MTRSWASRIASGSLLISKRGFERRGVLDVGGAAGDAVVVHEDEDGALDDVLRGLVGPHAQHEGAALQVVDLDLLDRDGLDDVVEDLFDVGQRDLGLDIADRAANIARDEVQDLLRHRAEAPDAQVAGHHDDGQVGAGDQVVQVVVELAQVAVADLELLVDRAQLLVGRLELLLGGLELLVGALKLLVAGKDLLVARLQLLVGRFELLGDRLQVAAGRRQLGLEPLDRGSLRAAPLAAFFAGRRLPRRRSPDGGLSSSNRTMN